MDDFIEGLAEVACDVLVIGGGTAGPVAALKAKQKSPKLNVVLLEKANVKRSSAISRGMDGLNNAVVPGYATPEQYTKEITISNDGIVDQAPVYKFTSRCYDIIQELDPFGIRFQKTANGDFDLNKVHHLGTYVLPMPTRSRRCFWPWRTVLVRNRHGVRDRYFSVNQREIFRFHNSYYVILSNKINKLEQYRAADWDIAARPL